MLMPKKVKHRKQHRPKLRSHPKGGTAVSFGEWGLQALEHGYITNRQIESARVAMTRRIRRGGKVWVNIFPDRPISKKPAETRMGSGKGAPEEWVAAIRPGRVLFEIAGVGDQTAKEAMRLAAHKLPVACRILKRDEVPV